MNIIPKKNPQEIAALRLCLDFANTADWHASQHPEEKLVDYAALVAWARQFDLLTEPTANWLLAEALRCPQEASRTLERTIALREMIYRIFSAIARGNVPASQDLSDLNAALSEALSWQRIVATTNSFVWRWASAEGALEQMWWPVMRSAADLLTSDLLRRVGECADERGCGYLFLDLSKNRTRRWCDMKDCGNRAKAQKHYRKRARVPASRVTDSGAPD